MLAEIAAANAAFAVIKTAISNVREIVDVAGKVGCLLYTSPSPRDGLLSRMPSSA